jgi:hypothetical protein
MREVSKSSIGINSFPIEKTWPRASTLTSDLNEQKGMYTTIDHTNIGRQLLISPNSHHVVSLQKLQRCHCATTLECDDGCELAMVAICKEIAWCEFGEINII